MALMYFLSSVCRRCSSCSPRCFPSALPLAIAGARRTGRCGTGSGRQSFKSPFALLLQSVAIRATEGDAGAASGSHRYIKLQLVRPLLPPKAVDANTGNWHFSTPCRRCCQSLVTLLPNVFGGAVNLGSRSCKGRASMLPATSSEAAKAGPPCCLLQSRWRQGCYKG
jgi:hypothetical protein